MSYLAPIAKEDGKYPMKLIETHANYPIHHVVGSSTKSQQRTKLPMPHGLMTEA